MWNDTSKFDMQSHVRGIGHRDRVTDVAGAIDHLYGDNYPYEWDGVAALGGHWRDTRTGEMVPAIEHVGLTNWPDGGEKLLPNRDVSRSELPASFWCKRWQCGGCQRIEWAHDKPAPCSCGGVRNG